MADAQGKIDTARRMSRLGKLRKIYLVPEVRSIGPGKHLLERARARAKDLGFEVVVLETASVMKKAIRLYTRLGFSPYSKQPRHRV